MSKKQTPIEINPIPVQIGYVWYYEKVNCLTSERYISVEDYHKRFGEYGGKYSDNRNATKPIVVYDEKTKETLRFNSYKEAAEYTSVSRSTIWEVMNLPFRKKVRNRYLFSVNEIEQKKDDWEYSNKKFA